MGKSIGIRVDLGSRVGSGHWVRMHTLADSLIRRGHHVTFFSRNQNSSNVPVASAHPVLWLSPFGAGGSEPGQSQWHSPRMVHPDFLPVPPDIDLRDFAEAVAMSGESLDLLIVDHYGIESSWERSARRIVRRIAVVDDLADRIHDTDLLLDTNYYCDMAQRYTALIPGHAKSFLGPSFALLRPMFEETRRKLKRTSFNTVPLAAICFGGQDLRDCNLKVARTLLASTPSNVMVMGTPNPANEDSWNALRTIYGNRIAGPSYFENPAEVFAKADFFVGAGGSSTWERFALGLPGIVYSIAKNQEKMSADAAKGGYQLYLGDFSNFEPSTLMAAVAQITDRDVYEPMVEKMMNLVDGLGTSRVADALEALLST